MRKINIITNIAMLSIGIVISPTPAHSQNSKFPIDFTYTCNGAVDNQSNRAIQLFANYRLGGMSIDGYLNGDAFTGSEFSVSPQFSELVGYPQSQNTGNVRDIKTKMTVTIQKDNGVFRLKIVGVHGYSFFLSGGGVCQKN